MTVFLPKKRFGQHFLTDKNLLDKIVRTAGVLKGDVVLEIGPGPGALTEALLNAGAKVAAVEIDRRLAGALEERFKGNDDFELIRGDALKLSFADLSLRRGAKFKCVSNLPYNISGPLLFKFFREREAFTGLTLMLQKEVALRIASGPSTKDYGILSVLLQAYFDVRVEFGVSKDLFRPRPKVDSSVVSLSRLAVPRIDISDEGLFISVVKGAFGMRRKTLLNALKGLALGADMTEALHNAGIDPKRRGETLSLAEFGRLTEAVKASLSRENP